jgi:predicted glycosyltransferase
MSGTTAIERPKERAILSIPSISFFPGKRAAIRAYPGTKRTIGRAKITRSGLPFTTGR